eukprot:1413556-Rhodomonas_salina.1
MRASRCWWSPSSSTPCSTSASSTPAATWSPPPTAKLSRRAICGPDDKCVGPGGLGGAQQLHGGGSRAAGLFFLVADTWSVLGRPIVGHGADEWAGVVQLVNINDLSRIQLLAFFLNAYNLMVLHAHV